LREGRWKRVYQHRTRSYAGVEPGNDGHPGPYAFVTVPAALYDLEVDTGETTDVAVENADVVERLDSLAALARDALGDGLAQRKGNEVRQPGRRRFDRPETVEHLAVAATVTLATSASPRYPGSGPPTLIDGELGSGDFHDGNWLGFEAEDLDAIIDLGEPREISRIALDCLRSQVSWIFLPPVVEFAVSADGEAWTTVGREELTTEIDPQPAVRRIEVETQQQSVQFVRVRARNLMECPEWHVGAGGKAWLFVDEIIVR